MSLLEEAGDAEETDESPAADRPRRSKKPEPVKCKAGGVYVDWYSGLLRMGGK